MKSKLAIGIGVVLVLLVAGVLVVPGLIDWNDYKALIAGKVKEATGRDLDIKGDIELSILPAPAVTVNDLRLSNVEGAASPDMLLLSKAEVRVAFMPLLGGNVQVETVRLVEPYVDLEILADGRANWQFEAAGTAPAETGSAPGEDAGGGGGSAGGGFDLRLDHFEIIKGTVVYRDARSGLIEQVQDINATLAMASLQGPFESDGRLVVRGFPLSYEATVGKLIQGRTAAVDLTVGLDAGATELAVGGTVVDLENNPGFKGKVELSGKNLAGLLRGVTGGDAPALLARSFGLGGAVNASADRVEVSDGRLNLGETRGSLTVTAALKDAVNVQAELGLGRVDLDSWLAAETGGKGAGGTKAGGGAPVPQKPAASGTAASGGGFALPKDIGGSVQITAEAIAYNGNAIRQARLNAELGGGEITLSQLSAQTPGNGEVAAFGFVTPKDGQPRFEGELEARVSDLRSLLAWLEVPVDGVPKDRLRQFTYQSRLVGTPAQLQVPGIKVDLDSTKVTGGVTLALQARPSFGAQVAIDRLDVDAYLPPATAGSAGSGGSGGKGGAKDGGKTAPGSAGGDPLAGLAALGGFDANLKATLGQLTYQGKTARDVVVDGTLYNGDLDLREVSVGNLAGASARVSGGLTKLAAMPQMKDLKVSLQAPDLKPLFALAAVAAPPVVDGLGKVSVKATGNGSLLKPSVDMALNAAGAEATLAGSLDVLPAPTFDTRLAVRHGDAARLLRTFAPGYAPRGPLGALDLKLKAKGGLQDIAISGIDGRLGDTALGGTAQVALAGSRPKVTAKLQTGELPLHRFLPAQKTASLPLPGWPHGLRGIVPAAATADRDVRPSLQRVATGGGRIDPRWPKEPLDLSALRGLDADVTLAAEALLYDALRFDDADIAATLTDGVLDLSRFAGALYGGPVKATARLDARNTPALNADLTVQKVDVGRLVQAAAGKGVASGRLNLDFAGSSQGGSVAGLVSALGGKGSLALTGLDVRKGAKGSPMAGLLDLVLGLNALGGNLGGGGGGTSADLSGSYTIERGVVRSTDLRLASGVGNGKATATVDLPAWTIDSKGEVTLAQSVLGRILAQKTNAPQTLPFSVSGRLDAPNVKLDTGALPGKGIAVPGLDKVLKKDDKVGKVLQGILGGAVGQQPQQQQQQPESQPSGDGGMAPPPPKDSGGQKSREVKPEDLLKGLFGR